MYKYNRGKIVIDSLSAVKNRKVAWVLKTDFTPVGKRSLRQASQIGRKGRSWPNCSRPDRRQSAAQSQFTPTKRRRYKKPLGGSLPICIRSENATTRMGGACR